MKIFIMRHGEAETYAASDAQRALTNQGREQSQRTAISCAQEYAITEFDRVFVSPYLRAQQTWQAVSHYFNARQVETLNEITPFGQAASVVDYVVALAKVEPLQQVLIISHLPLVGYLTAELVQGITAPMFPTSGVCCVDYDLRTEQGKLVWRCFP